MANEETTLRAQTSCASLAHRRTILQGELAQAIKQERIDAINDEIANVIDQQTKLGCLPEAAQFSGLTAVGAGAASSGNTFVFVVVDTNGRVFYNWSVLSGQPTGWIEIPNAPKTDAAPAVALVGNQHNFLFVILKAAGTSDGPAGRLFLAQGTLGETFNPWTAL